MSTGLKRTWRSGDTWRNLAYTYFRESGQWRYLLELNPSFDIRYQPSPGVEVVISGATALGKNQPAQVGAVGTLKTVDTNIDLRSSDTTAPGDVKPGVFPWDSFGGYSERLGDYTAAGLLSIDRANGFALDSPQASADTQRAN